MPDPNVDPPEPVAEPTIEELLLARINSYSRQFEQELELLQRVTDQLEPDRAASCRATIRMIRIMVDEVARCAAGGPLDVDDL
jgi:hypothetical protein